MNKSTQKNKENSDKYVVTFEDNESISIWRYDKSKFNSGPYEVEYKWKKDFNPWDQKKKTLGDIVKDTNKKRSEKL